MDKQLRKSYRDDQREYIQQQNAICSRKFLDALIVHHGEPSVIIDPLPPADEPIVTNLEAIPNIEIAKAVEIAFPAYMGRVEAIQRATLMEFPRLRMIDLKSQRRTALPVKARQIAMYLAKTLTALSLPEIGRRFGGRDHTTVLHSVRKISGLIERDPVLAAQVERIVQFLPENFSE